MMTRDEIVAFMRAHSHEVTIKKEDDGSYTVGIPEWWPEQVKAEYRQAVISMELEFSYAYG